MKKTRTLFWSLVSIAILVAAADACPTCKQAVSENGGDLVSGYFWSICFMMSMPFLIFGGMSTMFYLDVRRARLRKAAEKSAMLTTEALAGSV